MNSFRLDGRSLQMQSLADLSFKRQSFGSVEIPADTRERIQKSYKTLTGMIESRLPIYGVTTGFGDSCSRFIEPAHATQLQANLISYLLCGTGPVLSEEASRAIFAVRLNSLCGGFSGASPELIDRMKMFLERDWIPVIPREGSLGASGDLIPLAYLAQVLQGQGQIFHKGKIVETSEVLKAAGISEYQLKPKEGLALVNGTSAMAGQFLVNWNHANFLVQTLSVATAWLVLALKGRTEAFNEVVNEKSKRSPGQSKVARQIRSLLQAENYSPKPLNQIRVQDLRTDELVQDRYSIRCVPQILGPIEETLSLLKTWLEDEINGTSDNPLIGDDASLSMGGNFYGGYMSHGMDYLKISMAHMADLLDRQLMTVIDEKSNRGLPANLADWNSIPENERHLHHGLKGLHQSVSAITSEIIAKANSNGILSRSSESHNQDKVSLGMSAAVQCADMMEPLFTITTMHLIVLAQALDLRGVKLQGALSKSVYGWIRETVPFVSRDQAMGNMIENLRIKLKQKSAQQGQWFNEKA